MAAARVGPGGGRGGVAEALRDSPYGQAVHAGPPRGAKKKAGGGSALRAGKSGGPGARAGALDSSFQRRQLLLEQQRLEEEKRLQREEVEQHMLEGADSDDDGGNSEDEGEVDLKELYGLATQDREEILPRELRSVFTGPASDGDEVKAAACLTGCFQDASNAFHLVETQCLCECLMRCAGSDTWEEDGMAASTNLQRQLSQSIALLPEREGTQAHAALSTIGRSFFAGLTTAETVFHHAKKIRGPLRQGWRFLKKGDDRSSKTSSEEGLDKGWDSDDSQSDKGDRDSEEGYMPPPGEGGYIPPLGEGGYMPPPGEGGYMPPPGEGGYMPPPGEGGYMPPPGQGGYMPPPGGGGYEPPPTEASGGGSQGKNKAGSTEAIPNEDHPEVVAAAEREAHWMSLLAFAKLMVPVFRSTGLVHPSLSDFTVVALCAIMAHTGGAEEMADFGRKVRDLKNLSVEEYEAGLCKLRRSAAYRHFTKSITSIALSETPFMNIHARLMIKRSARKVLFFMMGIGLVTSIAQFIVLISETQNEVTGHLVLDVLILSLLLTVPGLLSLSIIANVLQKPSNALVTVMLHLRLSVLTKARFVRSHGAISSKQDLVRTSSYLLNLVKSNSKGLSQVAQMAGGDKGADLVARAEEHMGRVQEKLDSMWQDPEMGRPLRGVSMIQRRYAEASFFRRSLSRSTTISSVLMYITVVVGVVAQSLLHFRVYDGNNCRPDAPDSCSEHLSGLTIAKYGIIPFVTFPVSAMCTMFTPLLFCKAYLAFAVCAHRLNTDILAQMMFATLPPAEAATISAENLRRDPTPTPQAFEIVTRHRAALRRSYMRAKRLTNMLNTELHGLIAVWVAMAVVFWAMICILIALGDKRPELLFAVALLPSLVTWMLICVSSANPNLDNINTSTDRQRNRDVAAGRGLGYMPNTMVTGHTVPRGDEMHWSDAFQTLVRTSPLGIRMFGFKLSPKAVAAQAYSAFTLSVTIFASHFGLL